MGGWATACERLVLLSESARERAERLLGVEHGRCHVVPNGFDPRKFAPARGHIDRLATWRRVLVDEPRGWRPGEDAGSVRYAAEDLAAFATEPVLVYVGRFTEVKRVGLLIEAHARTGARAPLVLVGGHPGEWEGEHPQQTIERTRARNVFLAGWHDHDELPDLLHAADVLVLPSVREQFGQVLVEAMASSLPCIAVDRFGPARIVRDGETGWLVEPDDLDDLASALAHAVSDREERQRRGRAACADARERYSWPALAGDLAAVLESARTHELVAR
jgi:glycosyltransferase involved in cell wall biosynthesis